MEKDTFVNTTCGIEVEESDSDEEVQKLTMIQLQKEIQELRKEVKSKVPSDGSFSGFSTPTVYQPIRRSFLKPKDINVLRSDQLTKVEGSALVESFFKQMREVTKEYSTSEKVQICLSRVDEDLRLFLENKIRTQKGISIDDLEEIIVKEFEIPRKLADVIDKLISEANYDLNQDPRVFTQQFKIKYSILETVFKSRGLPPFNKLLKRVLTRNLDSHTYNRLGSVVMDDFSAEEFLDRIEALRLSHTMGGTVNSTSARPYYEKPRCRYCKNGHCHYIQDCPLKPQRGACYDCRNIGHMAGDRSCPNHQ